MLFLACKYAIEDKHTVKHESIVPTRSVPSKVIGVTSITMDMRSTQTLMLFLLSNKRLLEGAELDVCR